MDSTLDEILACPCCLGPVERESELESGRTEFLCPHDGLQFPVREGIVHMVRPERREQADAFAAEYPKVWYREGWGSPSSEYLLNLPYRDTTARQTGKWRVKARSFESLLAFLETRAPNRIVDLGAGVGWLSYRLVKEGYRVVALDVSTDRTVGLGAAQTYADAGFPFLRVRGELEHPPLLADSADVAVYNASLHYLSNPNNALRRAGRLVREGGSVVVMNSPVHRDPESAQRAERDFRSRLRQQGASSATVERFHHFVRAQIFGALEEAVGPVHEIPFEPGLVFRLGRWMKGIVLGLELASFPILVAERSG